MHGPRATARARHVVHRLRCRDAHDHGRTFAQHALDHPDIPWRRVPQHARAERTVTGAGFACGTTSERGVFVCIGPSTGGLGVREAEAVRLLDDAIVELDASAVGVCARFLSGDVRCLGSAARIELEGARFRRLAMAPTAICGVLNGGAVRCFGDVRLATPPPGEFLEIGAGGSADAPFACGADVYGIVRCWGPGVAVRGLPAVRE